MISVAQEHAHTPRAWGAEAHPIPHLEPLKTRNRYRTEHPNTALKLEGFPNAQAQETWQLISDRWAREEEREVLGV